MSRHTRITDPKELPVQLNIRVPFALREQMIKACERERISQSTFVTRAIQDALNIEALVG